MKRLSQDLASLTDDQLDELLATLEKEEPQGSHAATDAEGISRVSRERPLPLSFAQQRLWFLERLEERAHTAYSVPGGLRLLGTIDVPALQAALDRVVARHEALRTCFASVDGTPVQLIAPPETARANIRARGEKARSEGLRGMNEIANTLVQAATSTDTKQRQPVALAFVRESLMRQDPEGYARICASLADCTPSAVERIAAPTLLVTGDEDGVAPPQSVRNMAERLVQAKSRRTVVLNRCGHWTPIERPEDCARELRSFLSAQR